MRTIRIGGGAGYSGDRIEPAVELAKHGDLDVLVFECLAERTIALAQAARLADPASGYDPLLATRLHAVLPDCIARGIKIVTNMGAANPLAAAGVTRDTARSLGMRGVKIAAVTGDDVLDIVRRDNSLLDDGRTIAALGDRVISANAYIGAGPIATALGDGAAIVITGRAADPALFLGPLIHAFGWAADDWTMLGRGTVVGHLLECAGQITGGYFADPGSKEVAGLARLGFPIGEVSEDGAVVITKVAGSGGQVTLATVKEQLMYEIHDPAQYFQPDVVADFSGVRVERLGQDRVRVSGGSGAPKTGSLKVSVGYRDSFAGEGQISYAGPGAQARGQLALEIVRDRMALSGVATTETRFELIGVNALGIGDGRKREPDEVRVRVVGRTGTAAEAKRIGDEVETLYTNGPAGGGGVSKFTREIIAVSSTSVPESAVETRITVIES